jgi:hypothetical protein
MKLNEDLRPVVALFELLRAIDKRGAPPQKKEQKKTKSNAKTHVRKEKGSHHSGPCLFLHAALS